MDLLGFLGSSVPVSGSRLLLTQPELKLPPLPHTHPHIAWRNINLAHGASGSSLLSSAAGDGSLALAFERASTLSHLKLLIPSLPAASVGHLRAQIRRVWQWPSPGSKKAPWQCLSPPVRCARLTLERQSTLHTVRHCHTLAAVRLTHNSTEIACREGIRSWRAVLWCLLASPSESIPIWGARGTLDASSVALLSRVSVRQA